jgi:glycine/D-amino acid oxidase-like deaminating enzyme
MNNRAIHLPHDDQDCGWYAALPAPVAPRRLTGRQQVDYAVIGAGFAGLAAARQLAEHLPDARIVLVDAQRVGYGASGRNSGFVIDLPHKMALEHPDPAHKQRLLGLNRSAIAQLQRLIGEHRIDCQWSHAGKYQGAVGARGLAYLEHFEHLMRELGEPFHSVEGDQLANVLGTRHYRRAVYTPGSYLMQPAALVRGLADSLPGNVELLEESPIQGLQRDAQGQWLLQGRDGQIRTPRLLLGTSIFTQEFGYLRSRLLPVMTFASWTRPLTQAEMDAIGMQADWGLTPADHAGTTVRMTQDRRLMIRNTYKHVPRYGKSVSDSTRHEIRAGHRKALISRYPQLANVEFTHTWGGVYAISRNFTNFFGELEDGVYATACDNGVGAAWGTISGTLLADLAVGADSQSLSDIRNVTGMPSRNPPEPLLGLGVRTRIRLAAWNSRSEL